jgi:excinuclease UvrABC ATPase subunit
MPMSIENQILNSIQEKIENTVEVYGARENNLKNIDVSFHATGSP